MKIQFKRDYPYCGRPRFRSGDEVEAFDSYEAEMISLSGSYKIGRRMFKVRDERGQVWLIEENHDAVAIEVPAEAPQ